MALPAGDMRRLVFLCLFFRGVLVFGEQVPTDEEIVVGKLANGLMYYIRENRFPRRQAEMRLVVKNDFSEL